MVLYQAYQIGSLTQCIIHRFTVHRSEKAILLVGKGLQGAMKHEQVIQLKNYEIFDDVIAYETFVGARSESVEECENRIQNEFDKVFKVSHYDLNKFSAIYSGADVYHSFGIYLSKNKIPYVLYEVCEHQILEWNNRYYMYKNEGTWDNKPYYDTLLKYHAICGNDFYVINKLLFPKSVPQGLVDDKVKVFDFEKAVLEIQKKDVDKILGFFKIPEDLPKNVPTDLLLTKSQWELRNEKHPEKVALHIYEMLMDYYFPESENPLVIKPHPFSKFTVDECKMSFPNAFVIEPSFPSNLIPLLSNFNIENVVSTGSSGIERLGHKLKNSVNAGLTIYKMYPILHKMFAAFSIINYLKYDNYTCYHYGISNEFINNFISIVFNNTKFNKSSWLDTKNLKESSFGIIDDINWNPGNFKEQLLSSIETMAPSTLLFFLNSKNDYCFLNDDCNYDLNNIIPIIIKKLPIRDKIFENLCNEYIYIYCKDDEIKEKLSKINFEKTLYYTGIKLQVYFDEGYLNDVYERIANRVEFIKLHEENILLNNKINILENKVNTLISKLKEL